MIDCVRSRAQSDSEQDAAVDALLTTLGRSAFQGILLRTAQFVHSDDGGLVGGSMVRRATGKWRPQFWELKSALTVLPLRGVHPAKGDT